MKIAIIGQKGIPALAGGVERHVEEVAARMAQKGHEVTAYVRNNYTEKTLTAYRGVRLIHLPSIRTKRLDAITHTFLSTAHALFQNYDIIHFHSIGPATLCWIIRVFKKNSQLIATFHSRDYFHQKWGMAARIFLHLGEYLICTVPKKTVVLTSGQQQYVRETYRKDTAVIPNGYGINYDPGAQELAAWGLKKKKYILSVCRLIPHKGIHYLIDAFKQLEDAGEMPTEVKLVIVGSGFHTDVYEQQLRDMSRDRPNIIFTGTQSGQALAQLYSHACVFVQPSESEGLSISLLEAMGCGTAPLVSSIAENMEPLQGLGFSFTTRSVEDLKNRLSEVLHDSAGAEAMGKKVRALAEREYNWDSIAERYLRLYEELLGQ